MPERRVGIIRTEGGLPAPADGWNQLRLDGEKVDIWFHLGLDDESRWVVDGVHFGGTRVLADDLRSVPIGQIERLMNTGALQRGEEPAEMQFVEDKLIRRPGDSPETFARKVARQYRYYASVSKSPTKALAEASEVPMSTARWWIREARRLGELPPGRKGKVG